MSELFPFKVYPVSLELRISIINQYLYVLFILALNVSSLLVLPWQQQNFWPISARNTF